MTSLDMVERIVKSLFEQSVAKPFLVIGGKFFHAFIVVYYLPVAPLGLRCMGLWRFYTPSIPLGHLVLYLDFPSRSIACSVQVNFHFI